MRLSSFTYVATIQALAQWGLEDTAVPNPHHTYLAIKHEDSNLYGIASFASVEGAGYLEFKASWFKPNTEPHYLLPFWHELNEMDSLTRSDPEFEPPPF